MRSPSWLEDSWSNHSFLPLQGWHLGDVLFPKKTSHWQHWVNCKAGSEHPLLINAGLAPQMGYEWIYHWLYFSVMLNYWRWSVVFLFTLFAGECFSFATHFFHTVESDRSFHVSGVPAYWMKNVIHVHWIVNMFKEKRYSRMECETVCVSVSTHAQSHVPAVCISLTLYSLCSVIKLLHFLGNVLLPQVGVSWCGIMPMVCGGQVGRITMSVHLTASLCPQLVQVSERVDRLLLDSGSQSWHPYLNAP